MNRTQFDVYDPKFVHFEWDPSLEGLGGNKVILADDISKLQERVRAGRLVDSSFIVAKGCDSYPFELGTSQFRFMYYDPDLELKIAWKEGKELQFKSKIDGGWAQANTPCWGEYEFRVKPTEEMQPFSNTEELVDFFNSRFMKGLEMDKCTMPFIWIMDKVNGYRQLVTSYGDNTVFVDDDTHSMRALFEQFTFLDGSPIGKEVVHNEEKA